MKIKVTYAENERERIIVNQIQALHNIKYIKVLFKVYVQFKAVRQAAKEMEMTYPYVIKQRKKALIMFEEVYADVLKTC